MALNAANIQAAAAAAVELEMENQFPAEWDKPEPPTEEEMRTKIGAIMAAAVRVAIDSIISDADVTGVTAGADTVTGAIQ